MIKKLLTIIILLVVPACFANKNIWSTIKTTSPGPASSIGSYSNGCLAGGESLPPDSKGYQVMRLTRGRFYGNPVLVNYIKELGTEAAKGHGMLLVGDMAQPRGGPIIGGHSSHQTGLDVDIWYTHPQKAKKSSLTLKEREEVSPRSLVFESGDNIDPNIWENYYATLLHKAANHSEVDRIFVDPAIKKKLCSTAKGSMWLRKIRPWWHHNDHFHVRLKCPEKDKNCIPQPSNIPEGDGCDATLDWWFTEEAKIESHKPHKIIMTIKPMQKMPKVCQTLAIRDN